MTRRELITLLCCGIGAWQMAAYAQQRTQVDQRVADLAHAGKIRIGVFPSTQYSEDSKTGEPKGLAIDITRAIAARLGIAEVIPIKHIDPVAVVACVKAGECDLGFISIEPDRATEVDFTPPYIRRDFTYLVPAGSLIHNATDADRPGVRIAAVSKHASTAALVRTLKQVKPIYAEDLDSAFDLLRTGNADALASVRELVLRFSAQLPGSRVLEDSYESGLVGIVVQKGHAERLAYISDFLDEAKRSGRLRQLIDSAGLRGFEVVTPRVPN